MLAAGFIVTSMLLAMLASHSSGPRSILDQPAAAGADRAGRAGDPGRTDRAERAGCPVSGRTGGGRAPGDGSGPQPSRAIVSPAALADSVQPMTRFVFITGGVVSSLGKGLASAAIGALLQARGYSVRLRKLDPYLNVDPGTMSPYQHGEVYVTDDGAETDLDLGHYERFTGVPARGNDSVTAGRIYSRVLTKERHGDYLGGTVQVVPHVTDMIKACILRRRRRCRFRALRDRRHRRRHRGPAVPRGDPPDRFRARPRPGRLRPPHARALSGLGRRAQDQADPAFGARATRHRHPAGPAAVPRRAPDPARGAAQDRAAMQRPAGLRDPGARRRQHLRGAGPLPRGGPRHPVAPPFPAAA